MRNSISGLARFALPAILCLPALFGASAHAADSAPDSRIRFEELRKAIEADLLTETDPRASGALRSARATVVGAGRGLANQAEALAAAGKVIEKKAPGRPAVDTAAREALNGLLEDATWELESLSGALAALAPAKAAKTRSRIQSGIDQAGALADTSVAKAAKALVAGARLLRDLRIPPVPGFGGTLRVVSVSPIHDELVPLNAAVVIRFSGKVLPASIRPDTITLRIAPNFTTQVFGTFEVAGNTVIFHPRLPVLANQSDTGFPKGAKIRLTVVGYPSPSSVQGPGKKPLASTVSLDFTTAADGGLLYDYFRYRDAPPPRVRGTFPVDVLPADPWAGPGGAVDVATDVHPVLRLGRTPLDPASLPSRVSLRCVNLRGTAVSIPVPGTPVLDQDNEEVRITFVPSVVLADASRYVLRVDSGVTDLSGQFEISTHAGRSALNAAAALERDGGGGPLVDLATAHPYAVDPRTYLVFTTRQEAPSDRVSVVRFDGSDPAVDGGDGSDPTGTTASFNTSVPGAVAATITGPGGDGHLGDFIATSNVTLDTGSPLAVNGEFDFRSIRIKPGVTVTLTGSLPAILRASTGVLMEGNLVASGSAGDGATAQLSSSVHGGAGGPGGGAGGNPSPLPVYGLPGGSGSMGTNFGGGGGTGGFENDGSTTYCFPGGGGGGGHRTDGIPGSKGSYGTSTWNGLGGSGGGVGGASPDSGTTAEGRNFSGQGGGGGGAGGNNHYNATNPVGRSAAAGGGGGGGAVLITTSGPLVVTGTLAARGGAGGVTNYNPYNGGNGGGGPGGGGAGGTLALYTSGSLDVTGATFDVRGGAGGPTTGFGWIGAGGAGGTGYIRLESGTGTVTGTAAATLLPDYSTGLFNPASTAADTPSVFTGTWFDLGAMAPEILPFAPQDFVEQEIPGCTIRYEIQMAAPDAATGTGPDLGALNPVTGDGTDPARASVWTDLKTTAGGILDPLPVLNGRGYRFYRLRITFTLKDGLRQADALPFVDEVRVPFRVQ